VQNLAAAGEQLIRLLVETGAKSALCWTHDLLARVGLSALLDEAQIRRFDCETLAAMAAEDRKRAILACDVGITSCDWAIAETGSLVMCSRPGQERVASLTPPVHIAIVERVQIVPDLIDAFERLAARDLDALPSNVTLITGPSKTGDIELQLTTGVHGPGKWRVMVIE
jgi:L-lactate utilization protein LutC